MRVLVIIPAFNEQDSIESVITELREAQPDFDYVVINDCSTDNTKRILEDGRYSHVNLPVNLGIGGGVQTGYRYAAERGYDIAVQMDGDGQHDPKCLTDICRPVMDGDLDMCVGSRFLTNDGFQTSAMRRLGINFLSFLIRLFGGVRIRDATSGFRACGKELIRFFSQQYAQDYPEPEAIISAVTAGFRVGEVQVSMRERKGGVSSISPLRSIYYMIKVSLSVILCRLMNGGRK